MPRIRFYGSQVGGEVIIPHSYTGSPLELLRHDIWSALGFFKYLPFIVWPIRPTLSNDFCELYPSWQNLWAMFVHFILILLQLAFILSVPLWLFVPVPMIIAGVVVFFMINSGFCYLLNGSQMRFKSDPKFTKSNQKHEKEQWIFLNGVAVG